VLPARPDEARYRGLTFQTDVRFFDTGHFALETPCDEIAAAIHNFLKW
jgi:hypothetical protein